MNIYQQFRKEHGNLSREEVEKATDGKLSVRRLEKIETNQALPHPEDIIEMARVYKMPELNNYYCTNECAIGKRYIPSVRVGNLSQIVLQMLNTLEDLDEQKRRLVQITVDETISDDEMQDFAKIKKMIEQISMEAQALQVWVEQQDNEGKINKKKLDQLEEERK